MARFKVISVFLLAWLAAGFFWSVLLRAWAVNHPDSRITQGLVGSGMV